MHKGLSLVFSRFSLPAIFCIVLVCCANSQVYGGTYPHASNYYPMETVSDGSCVPSPVSANLPVVINPLPQLLTETSGLILYAGGLWTHNDSDGLPQIYKFDTVTGEVLQTITIGNGANVDWEDITQDSNYIYIGDFGNNSGDRRDLAIYRIEKSQIPTNGDTSLSATLISFSYSDQSGFSTAYNNNNYDCEAMICAGDSLYLFSKRWLDHKSMMYVLPKTPGTWIAQKRDSLEAFGLVTGADISTVYNEVSLIGYNNSTPIVWLLFDYPGTNFLKGNKRRINFPGQTGAQTEGIAYSYGRKLFISSENTPIYSQRLYSFNTSRWTTPTTSGWNGNGGLPDFDVATNPSNDNFTLIRNGNTNRPYAVELNSVEGKPLLTGELNSKNQTSDFTFNSDAYSPVIYLLKIISDDFRKTKKLFFE